VLTGLTHFDRREYSAGLQTWIGMDPLYTSTNWYVAFGNNPVNRVDPWGLELVVANVNSNTYAQFHALIVSLAKNLKQPWAMTGAAIMTDGRVYFNKEDRATIQKILAEQRGQLDPVLISALEAAVSNDKWRMIAYTGKNELVVGQMFYTAAGVEITNLDRDNTGFETYVPVLRAGKRCIRSWNTGNMGEGHLYFLEAVAEGGAAGYAGGAAYNRFAPLIGLGGGGAAAQRTEIQRRLTEVQQGIAIWGDRLKEAPGSREATYQLHLLNEEQIRLLRQWQQLQ
jgi:hypothetical protein